MADMEIDVHMYLPELDVTGRGTAGSSQHFKSPVESLNYIIGQIYNLKPGEKITIEAHDPFRCRICGAPVSGRLSNTQESGHEVGCPFAEVERNGYGC